MTSSSLSPLGDLLGLFDSPQTSAQPGADTAGKPLGHGPSPASTGQAEPSNRRPGVYTPPLLGGLSDGEQTQIRLPGGMPQAQSTPQGPELSSRRSLGLASSSSWGPFYDSEAAEAAVTNNADSTTATSRAHAATGSASATSGNAPKSGDAARSGDASNTGDVASLGGAARSGNLARSGDAAKSGNISRSGSGARSGSPELRWTAPRCGSDSLPTSPFQHHPPQQPFGAPHAARTSLEDRFTSANSGAADRERPSSSRPEGAQMPLSETSKIAGTGQPSSQHRPSRSDADSLASWGSFREPEPGDAPNQALSSTGQLPENDFLIRLSSTYSGHPSHHSEVDPDASSTAAPEQALRAQQLGQAGYTGQAPDQAQHLDQLDENGCWDGCMPGAEGSPAGNASEDPFRHVTLTEPQSHAQMQRGDGVPKQKEGVSDWEIHQISTFAAANSGRHVPMRKGSGGQEPQ